MNYTCTFQHPKSGWWITGSYTETTQKLILAPLDTVEQHVDYYNQHNTKPMTLEQIYIAKTAWGYANEWCEEHSGTFTSLITAQQFLRDLTDNDEPRFKREE